MILPIAPMVRPSVLDGQENGRLPKELLFPTGIPGLSMVKPAQRAMTAMVLVMMSELGPSLVMRQVGGYRSLAGQWTIFGGSAARYRPVAYAEWAATPTDRRKTWRAPERHKVATFLSITIPDSDYWVKIKYASGGYPATAAVPGTSNHGWALAADLAQEYDTDSDPDPIKTSTVVWLVLHAADFGYSAESQSEEWHWRYVAGDAIPQRVLDVEAFIAGTTPPPEPPPDPVPPTPTVEVDMITLDWNPGSPNWTALCWTGTELAHTFNGHADAVLHRAGVKRVTVNDDELLGIIQSSHTTTEPPHTLTPAMLAAWD